MLESSDDGDSSSSDEEVVPDYHGEEGEPLDYALAQLEIPDFEEVWNDDDDDSADSTKNNDESNNQSGEVIEFMKNRGSLGDDDRELFHERLYEREEVYSHRYKPTLEEQAEVDHIFKTTVTRNGSTSGLFSYFTSNNTNPVSKSTEETPEYFLNLLCNQQQTETTSFPKSILLYRGKLSLESLYVEMLLFTHGLVIRTAADKSSKRKKWGIYKDAIVWRDQTVVLESNQQDTVSTTFQLHSNGNTLHFLCPSPVQQQEWVQALGQVLLENAVRRQKTLSLGWQYHIVQTKPAFVLAVQGKLSKAFHHSTITEAQVQELDSFNGYTPLHYAVQLHHVEATRILLQQGKADPNQLNRDNMTAVQMVSDEDPEIAQLLLEHGGKEVRSLEGKLFGRVEATERIIQDKREQEHRKAQAAVQLMEDNRRLMEERRQQINQAHDAANTMNEQAQNFAQLAQQLKEKSKQQNNRGGFFSGIF